MERAMGIDRTKASTLQILGFPRRERKREGEGRNGQEGAERDGDEEP